MADPIIANDFLQDVLDDIGSQSSYLDNVRLFKNNASISVGVQLSDLTEADFSGYASESLSGTWGVATKVQDGEWKISSGEYSFTHNGGATDNTIYGAYVDDGVELAFVRQFDSPITMDQSGKVIKVDVAFFAKDPTLV